MGETGHSISMGVRVAAYFSSKTALGTGKGIAKKKQRKIIKKKVTDQKTFRMGSSFSPGGQTEKRISRRVRAAAYKKSKGRRTQGTRILSRMPSARLLHFERMYIDIRKVCVYMPAPISRANYVGKGVKFIQQGKNMESNAAPEKQKKKIKQHKTHLKWTFFSDILGSDAGSEISVIDQCSIQS
jgi:hypothetical protein